MFWLHYPWHQPHQIRICHYRSSGTGGGTGLLYRKDLKNEQLDTNEFKSFEFKELLLHSSASIIRTVFICRQPISAENGLTYALFFDEFSTLLEPLVTLVCASRKLLLSSSFRRQSLSISGCIKLFQSKRLKCQHPNSQIKVIIFWILYYYQIWRKHHF